MGNAAGVDRRLAPVHHVDSSSGLSKLKASIHRPAHQHPYAAGLFKRLNPTMAPTSTLRASNPDHFPLSPFHKLLVFGRIKTGEANLHIFAFSDTSDGL
jgi:hypothetical protein